MNSKITIDNSSLAVGNNIVVNAKREQGMDPVGMH